MNYLLLKDIKISDKARLEYVYLCQQKINDLRKIFGDDLSLAGHELVKRLKTEIQENLNNIGKE